MVQTKESPSFRSLLDRFADLDQIWPAPEQAASPRRRTAVEEVDHGPTDWSRPDRLGRFALRHRWGLIALAVIAALAAWLLLVAAPGYGHRLAQSVGGGYHTALDDLDHAIPEARSALQTLTDPAADGQRLSASIESLAGFAAAAEGLAAVAHEPLPATPPLVPRNDLDALEPMRTEMDLVAAQAGELVARLNGLLGYRLLFEGAFALPTLPSAADADAVDGLSAQLAAALAASVESVVSLPNDPLLDAHRNQAGALLETLEAWRTDYLSALRNGDPGEAKRLAELAESSIAEVRAALDPTLADIEAWGAGRLDELRIGIIETETSPR